MKPNEILDTLRAEHVPFEHINFNVLGGERPDGITDDHICKCMAVKAGSNIYIICIPINKRLDYKKIRRTFGERNVRLAKDVEDITGYEHGANGPIPISLTSDIPIFFDETFPTDFIISNIGEYGNTVKTQTDLLITLVNGRLGDFVVEEQLSDDKSTKEVDK